MDCLLLLRPNYLHEIIPFFFSIQDGESALMLASGNGHTEIAKYLIEANASVNLQKQVYYVKIKIIPCMFPVTD